LPRYVTFDIDAIHNSVFGSVLTKWEERCGSYFAPTWNSDLHFLDFDSGLIPRMTLVQVDGQPGVGIYRFWGTGIKTYGNCDQTNSRVGAQETPEMEEDFGAQYQQVVETGIPRCYATQIRLKDWDSHFKFEASLRLPFTSDGEIVDWILCVDHYADNWTNLIRALGVADVPQPFS